MKQYAAMCKATQKTQPSQLVSHKDMLIFNLTVSVFVRKIRGLMVSSLGSYTIDTLTVVPAGNTPTQKTQ